MAVFLFGLGNGKQLPGKTSYREVTIHSHAPGRPTVPGQVATCGDCQGESWAIFQVEGESSVHLQCLGCGAVYCYGHECDLNPAADAAAEMRGGG